jgi:hypothetical protein
MSFEQPYVVQDHLVFRQEGLACNLFQTVQKAPSCRPPQTASKARQIGAFCTVCRISRCLSDHVGLLSYHACYLA